MNTVEIAPVDSIIYVDGDEFIRCPRGDGRRLFNETVTMKIGTETALMEWSPSVGIYIRACLMMTGGA